MSWMDSRFGNFISWVTIVGFGALIGDNAYNAGLSALQGVNYWKLLVIMAGGFALVGLVLREPMLRYIFSLVVAFFGAAIAVAAAAADAAIQIATLWAFDKPINFSNNIYYAWLLAGCVAGVLYFIATQIQRIRYERALSARRQQAELDRLRELSGIPKQQNSVVAPHQEKKGFWEALSINPPLVLITMLCTIMGFVFGSLKDFVSLLKCAG